MDNVQEQSNRTSDISHTRVMVARTNIVLSVLETTDPGLYWGGNYCCVVVGWYAVSCRCGGRARGLPLLCFRVSRVSRVCRGVVVCGVSGGMGTAPAGFLILSGPSCYVLVRRRATLPHPVGCSTIAVPGLRFRVRNGSGRLPWAMAAANL